MFDYKNKYLKYKMKYLKLKGGAHPIYTMPKSLKPYGTTYEEAEKNVTHKIIDETGTVQKIYIDDMLEKRSSIDNKSSNEDYTMLLHTNDNIIKIIKEINVLNKTIEGNHFEALLKRLNEVQLSQEKIDIINAHISSNVPMNIELDWTGMKDYDPPPSLKKPPPPAPPPPPPGAYYFKVDVKSPPLGMFSSYDGTTGTFVKEKTSPPPPPPPPPGAYYFKVDVKSPPPGMFSSYNAEIGEFKSNNG